MPECVFCKIAVGLKECYKVYENERTIAFLDINPWVEGHTLVVPKNHVERLDELEKDDLISTFSAIKEVMRLLTLKLKAEGFNLVLNQGRVAGQEISHLHFHVFPRKWGDGGLFKPKRIDLEEVYKKIVSV